MPGLRSRLIGLLVTISLTGFGSSGMRAAEGGEYVSHPPMRPLPEPFERPMGEGPAYFVDPARGDDAGEGSRESPWKTVGHSLDQLQPGDTLYLGGGTYYENVSCMLVGTGKKPITIRAYPGELVIIDGGYREFYEHPPGAWETFEGGAHGEFRSTKTYPDLAESADPRWPVVASGALATEVRVLGNFGDSMVPLHGYHTPFDLRENDPYWNVSGKLNQGDGIYCGPGVWYATETNRIHARLAHINLRGLGQQNYRGETDPQKIPLVIGGRDPVLKVEGAKHVRFQDLVIRGTRSRTVNVSSSENIEFDGVTVYGGCPALFVQGTRGLRLLNSALRGVSAPWSFRSSEKYRGISTYLFIASGDQPQNEDFEMAYCEFTDCHDGLIIGTINGLEFHHNYVDNFNDDGLYLTALVEIGQPGKDVHIYQNWISRCYGTFSFAGEGKEFNQGDAYIYRNIIDLRGPVHIGQGPDAESAPEYKGRGRLWGDHGSPIWKPMMIYHNTIVKLEPPWRGYYGAGMGGHVGRTKRRLFNNMFIHVEGFPGMSLPSPQEDFQADGNLHWNVVEGPTHEGDFFGKFRSSQRFEESKAGYTPGWTVHDVFADPMFLVFNADWKQANDYRLKEGSPGVSTGIEMPSEWPDPLRDKDKGKPDIGVIPYGCEPWGVGVRSRIPVSPCTAGK
jgi:hypothetical protein